MPPMHVIQDVLLYTLLPATLAALTAAAVLAVVQLLAGPRGAAVGAALGFAGGGVLGNVLCGSFTLLTGESAWNRLPWAALAALLVGLVVRLPWAPAGGQPRTPSDSSGPAVWRVVGWLVRAATAAAAAWWVLPEAVRTEAMWLPAALAAVILAEWALLEHLAARTPGGGVPLALALSAVVGAAVLIHAGTARLTDSMTVLAAVLVGVAAVAAWRRLDAGGAVPGAAVLLPGVLLMGQQETFSEVQWLAFALAAAAPLVLAVTLLPPFRSWQGTRLRLLRFALLLAPLAVAAGLTLQAGPLEFE
jgi:hypothetical protein